jgi:hypothetical protein
MQLPPFALAAPDSLFAPYLLGFLEFSDEAFARKLPYQLAHFQAQQSPRQR